MKYIIGLGNPGTKYQTTRHNIGFMIVDFLAEQQKWQTSKKGKLDYLWLDKDAELIKPQTYMNDSGISVAYIKKKYPKIGPEDLIIIHDDVDIAFGTTKMTLSASSGGHNGIKSIIQHLGTQDFIRLRIGVGKSPDIPTDKYVLQKFTNQELDALPDIFVKTKETIQLLLENKITQAQKYFNTKPSS